MLHMENTFTRTFWRFSQKTRLALKIAHKVHNSFKSRLTRPFRPWQAEVDTIFPRRHRSVPLIGERKVSCHARAHCALYALSFPLHHKEFMQADVLDRRPDYRLATDLDREHINLIGASIIIFVESRYVVPGAFLQSLRNSCRSKQEYTLAGDKLRKAGSSDMVRKSHLTSHGSLWHSLFSLRAGKGCR